MVTLYNILAVDDERGTLKVVEYALFNAPEFKCTVKTAPNAEQALVALSKERFDLVVSDYQMPGMNGIDLLKEVRRLYPSTARIILTAHSDLDVILKALEDADVDFFVEKPWGKGKLTAAVANVLREKVK